MGLAKTILVPVDFAPPSLRACDRAVALARDLRANLILFHVVDAEPAEVAARKMRALANALRLAGVEIETRIVEGSPRRAIVAAASALKPVLVVCGTHNRRGLSLLALGSVAERIVRASSVPVLTVPGFAFESREQAGARLMMELPRHDLPAAVSVFALGMNAVPIAAVLARRLGGTLDLWDYVPVEIDGEVLGAFGEDELIYYDTLPEGPTSKREVAEERAKETLREQLGFVRGSRSFGDVLDRLVVLVAEHVSAPAPVRAAVRALRPLGASGVVLVTPIASEAAIGEVGTLVDGVVCLERTMAANPIDIAFRESAAPSYRKVRRLLDSQEITAMPTTRFLA